MAQALKNTRPQFASIEEEILWHHENGSNILIPTTKLETNEFYKPVIDEITLSIDDGDAYPRKDAKNNEKYALSLQGLNRLSMVAGVQWDPPPWRIDDCSDKLYVAMRARGGVRKADGSVVWNGANYDLDLEVIEEEIEEKNWNKCKNWNKSKEQKAAYVRDATKREFRQKRRHKLSLAESGAKARVLRALLGVKGLYTYEELARPFLVIRYIFQPPVDDPIIRRQIAMATMRDIKSVYGNALPYQQQDNDYLDITPSQPAAESDAGSHLSVVTPPAEAQSETPDESGSDTGAPENKPVEAASGEDGGKLDEFFTDPSQTPETLDDNQWEDATINEKISAIRELATHVGYDLVAFEKRAKKELSKLDDPKLKALYVNLCGMIK